MSSLKPLWGLLLGMLIAIGYSLAVDAANSPKAQYNTPFWIEAIGLVGGFGTTFAALPDCIDMIRTKSAKGMNPRMAAITGIFQVLWLVYGLLIYAPAVILWNAIAIVTNAITVSAYFYFSRQDRQ